jgi:hypothetical protein
MKIKIYFKNDAVIRIEMIKEFSREIFEISKENQIKETNVRGEEIVICKGKEK